MATFGELLERITTLEAEVKRITGNLVEIYGMLEPEEESDEDDEVVEEKLPDPVDWRKPYASDPDPMFPITIDTVLTTLDAAMRRFKSYSDNFSADKQFAESERAGNLSAMCKTAIELLSKYKGRKIV